MNAIKFMPGIIMSMLSITAQASFHIKIIIDQLPVEPATGLMYITGSFNGWNPRDESFRLQQDAKGHFFIELKQEAGAFEYKFTRGSWATVETTAAGADRPNRSLNIQSDTIVTFSIAGWKDASPPPPEKISTASAQVKIIDTAFAIPQLNRTRRIWIYLPKDYETSGKKYPVLYMHDGQNLFDNSTAFSGEWGIDEAMDSISNACIVVGIDNGGLKRMTEYNPNNTKQYGRGEGKAYLDFIVNNLKPFIDRTYHTLLNQQHTWMAGSSMGGLITFYAGLYYPEVFGKLGVFSPSFWIVPKLGAQVKTALAASSHSNQSYYFYAGGAEAAAMAANMEAVAAQMKKLTGSTITTVVNPEGKHNEPTWSAAFPAFYAWITQ